ncbi:MAG: DUF87 domain-containing protein [Schaedlerella sp.]|uniref:ATP-binding protein n=1 Tax=Schaedlerella sp. TaxID=2676057 RepID=UPI00265ED104|nr:DUF87 domain-containing protein [uncultured Schaedlerella sp.]
MHGNYVGKIIGEKNVYVGKNSPNQHMIISGTSGAGKSIRIVEIERNIIREGGTVIAFDINGTHEKVEGEIYNYISAQRDGLNVKLLDTSLVQNGQETMTNLLEYVMTILCPRQLRGAVQQNAVREALKFAIRNQKNFSTEMEAIAEGLNVQDSTEAKGAYRHLCDILEGNIFRCSEKQIIERRLNIISLKGINPKTQKRIIEIFLGVYWKMLRTNENNLKKCTLVIDEFQNLAFETNTVLFQMLTEARKYKLQLILATQTLTVFSKKQLAVINQAAVKLFFQPNVVDIRQIADFIEPGKKENWFAKLRDLKIGQAITVGELEINGHPKSQPIVTYSDYQSKKAAQPPNLPHNIGG